MRPTPEGSARDAAFLVNGRSRRGAEAAEEAKAALETEGFTLSRFAVTRTEQAFKTFLDECPAGSVVIVGGGDGTLRSAAEALADTDRTLGVLPLGTGNAWASDLGIPTGIAEAAKTLASAVPTAIDLGLANGRGFVNVATIGLTALIVENLPTKLKARFGKFIYLPAIIRSLRDLRPFPLRVETEGDTYDGMALQFVAAAGRTHAGPFRVTRHAENDDGLLSLYALDASDRRGFAMYGLGLLTGTHTFLQEVWSCEAKSASVTARRARTVIVDGEVAGQTPLELRIKHRALRVLIPVPDKPQAT